MNILVTGASGYIGSNLINELQKTRSFSIYALTRNNPRNYIAHENLHYIQCDLTDVNFTDKLPAGIDIVIHLAQSNHYRLFPEKAGDIYQININATHLLLEWARKTSVKKFIYSSSGNVYKREQRKLTENDACHPPDYYGTSKLIAELLVRNYSQFFSTEIIRIFGVYGPGQKGMLVANIINKLKNNELITLAKGIGITFSPLYIDDCVCMIQELLNDNSNSSVYNLSGSETVTLADVVGIIGDILSVAPNISFTEYEPQYLVGDNSLFIQSFRYTYRYDLVSGLQMTIKSN